MILIDTSVWIDFLKGRATRETAMLQRVLDLGSSFGINGLIFGELLAGARDRREQETLRAYFGSQIFLEMRTDPGFFDDAASIYFDCRRQGITLSGLVDCMIAQHALDLQSILLHRDADYELIARVRPLRFLSIDCAGP